MPIAWKRSRALLTPADAERPATAPPLAHPRQAPIAKRRSRGRIRRRRIWRVATVCSSVRRGRLGMPRAPAYTSAPAAPRPVVAVQTCASLWRRGRVPAPGGGISSHGRGDLSERCVAVGGEGPRRFGGSDRSTQPPTRKDRRPRIDQICHELQARLDEPLGEVEQAPATISTTLSRRQARSPRRRAATRSGPLGRSAAPRTTPATPPRRRTQPTSMRWTPPGTRPAALEGENAIVAPLLRSA